MKKVTQPDLAWLENPEIFAVNRMDPFSDHEFYVKEPGDLTLSLNGTWKVSVAENPDARNTEFMAEDYDLSDFDDIAVPGHLQTQGFLGNHYTNTIYPWDGIDELRPPYISKDRNVTASYATDFDLSEDIIRNFGLTLTFHGVETAFNVWLNGQYVGYAEDSFTPSHFDVREYAKPGKNRLAVEVFQRSSASWLEDQDMWRFMGIFRDVTLSLIPRIHIRDIDARQSVNLEAGLAELHVHLKNEVKEEGTISVSLWNGDQMLEQSEMPAAEKMQFDFVVDPVELWSAEHPHLYTLKLVVKAGDEVLEQIEQPIGFRKFEIVDGIMEINGKRIQFHGVNRHEFDAKHGRALPKETMDFDAAFMKQNNINAVRTSHYPNHSYWYELADKYGIYLIDETNLETHGSWQKLGVEDPSWNVPASLPEWKAAVLDRAKNMYERDKNHPSILIWSLGNEAYGGTNLIAMHDWFHEVDPSRPVHYEGTTWCRQFEDATDIESRMYAKPLEIEEYLTNNPGKPYISCEYEHAMGNSLGNMQEYMDLEKYPHYQGGFIWDYVDQAIQPEGALDPLYGGDFGDFPNDGNFSGDGILFADRTETPKTPEMKQLYRFAKIDIDKEGAKITNEYLFANLDEFAFQYIEKCSGEVIAQGSLEVNCPPQESVNVSIPWKAPEKPGIYTRTVTMSTKADTIWAKAGHELAFGEVVEDYRTAKEHAGNLRIAVGDGNMGVYGDNRSWYFQYQKGLVSIKENGQEMLNAPVRIELYRPLTDNDEGAGYGVDAGIWLSASKYARIRSWKTGQGEGKAWIEYEYEIPFVNLTAKLLYTVLPDCTLDVHLEMDLPEGTPMLPCFGLRFVMKKPYDQLSWLAKGPTDSYLDRDHLKTDVFASTTEEQFVTYLRPQECGSHMGTWSLTVSDPENKTGLQFDAKENPLQTSVLAWTSEQIANAMHPSELPPAYQNVVRILSEQMGVGGDDTWGAPVHDAYLIQKGKTLTCDFEVSMIG